MKNLFGACLLIMILALQCKKESTKWSPEYAVPLAFGELSVSNVINQDILEVNDNLISVHYEETLTPIDLSTLLSLGDTVIEQIYTPDLGIGPLPFNNSTNIFSLDESFEFNLDGAEIRLAKVSAGTLNISFESNVDGYLDLSFLLPGISLDGEALSLLGQTEPATDTENYQSSITVDISGYEFDLTGLDGTERNTIYGELNVATSAEPTYTAQIYGSDEIIIKLELLDIEFDEVRGFFGEFTVDLNVELRNYLGLDASIDLETVSALNSESAEQVNLENPEFFIPHNFTRAIESEDGVFPSVKTFLFDSNNSNLADFVSVTPTEIIFQGNAHLNPLGDVSGENDFYLADYPLEVDIELDVPLCLALDTLTLRDTLEIELDRLDDISKLVIKSTYENGFELEGELDFYVPSSSEPLANFKLNSATTADDPYAGNSDFELTTENLDKLKESETIIIEARLNTLNPEAIKILNSQKITLLFTAIATYEARI